MRARLASISALLVATCVQIACRVDNSGLGTMPVLPHDASSVGAAGSSGGPDASGLAGTTGAAGSGLAGAGDAGTTGAAGDTGAAGTAAAGTTGEAGTTGAAGDTGAAGTTGAAGDSGAAGAGAAGDSGAAGAGAAGTGAAGTGAAGTGAAGTGAAGAAGTGAAGTGAAGTGAAGTGALPCNVVTCANGCCDGNKCVTDARSNNKCGTGGGQCKACGKCEMCTNAGTCDVDPGSSWNVVCGSAVMATQPDFGMNWDPHSGAIGGTQPDPFCQFEMPANSVSPDTAGVTDTIIDSFAPTWNQVVSPQGKPVKAADLMSSAKTWRLWVGDDDGCTARGCVGQEACEINQPLTVGALRTGSVTHTNLGSCTSLTVKFTCAQ
jgi:hypothetical protein